MLRVENRRVRNWVTRMDQKASAATSRLEIAKMSRPVEC
jgi:hypothetical protein